MPPRADYEKTLDALAALLKRRPMTAKAIASHCGCARPVAYARLNALVERGDTVFVTRVRESVSGPKSKAYSIR